MNKVSFDDLNQKACVITGGAGVLGSVIAKGLASVGVRTAIVDINKEMADKTASEIEKESGTKSIGVQANVLDKESLQNAKREINEKLGKIDLLINGAGGNSPKATTQLEKIEFENLSELYMVCKWSDLIMFLI
jgi:NAD(P)-dependent dehydrogenase (short-subunit alcohol dehydrogenase family)